MPVILHTADWHLGKRLRAFRLIDEQREALDRLVDVAREERPDLVVIAGDLFDVPVPPVAALRLWERVTSRLIDDLGIPLVAIPGNHDAADRVALNAGRARDAGLVVVHALEQAVRPVVLGGAQVAAVPYHAPAQVRAWLARDADVARDAARAPGTHVPDDAPTTGDAAVDDAAPGDAGPRDADAAMATVLDRVRANLTPDLPAVLLAHAFVDGAGEEDDGEEPIVVGGAGGVRTSTLHGFEYVALGHLHGPRSVGPHDRIRYAGSLYPYAFGEPNAKSVAVVRIEGARDAATVEVRTRPLPVRRKVRLIEGVAFDDAVAAGTALRATEADIAPTDVSGPATPPDTSAHDEARPDTSPTDAGALPPDLRHDDYLLLRVPDREPIDHALARLRDAFPNALLEQPAIEVLDHAADLPTAGSGRPLDPETAFLTFYRHVFGTEPTAAEREILHEALEPADPEGDEDTTEPEDARL